MQQQEDWNKAWKASTEQAKQRKYRSNAPAHQRKRFVRARLHPRLREDTGVKTTAIRQGDTVEIMRGDLTGLSGEVTRIDYDRYKVYVDGIERQTVDGTQKKIPLEPSNLMITKLTMKDVRRLKQADEAATEKLREEQAAEEPEETAEQEDEQETEAPETSTESESEADYEELVSGTVSDLKDALEDFDGDLNALLEAEKNNKNRKTAVEAIEAAIGEEE